MFATTQAPPVDDERWRLVSATMRRYGYTAGSLIEVLHTVQSAFGYLNEEVLRYVASTLKVPLSRVYGVATFYHFFTLEAPGQHTCVVCTGTACHIKGAPAVLEAVEETLGLEAGKTSADRSVSLLTARCIGTCGLAPLAKFDDEVVGDLTPDSIVDRLQGWVSHDHA